VDVWSASHNRCHWLKTFAIPSHLLTMLQIPACIFCSFFSPAYRLCC
jgi:hypothetical protein